MMLNENTKAILLLTAPLILKKGVVAAQAALFSAGEYSELARCLKSMQKEPADLCRRDCEEWMPALVAAGFDPDRVRSLLGRGFQLAQAIENWGSRGIWVVSRADSDYPVLLKKRLQDQCPPILYGCGARSLLRVGGLAVVGSRKVDDALLGFTRSVGATAARGGIPVVSGGAKGVDQAAMQGALEAGGVVLGVTVESLSKLSIDASLRSPLKDGCLLLLSAFDPSLGFDVGRAMARNKLIYAFADAALVVASDYKKGGTWAGADEQLRRQRFLKVYVREDGGESKGLAALRELGAGVFPPLSSPEDLKAWISTPYEPSDVGSHKPSQGSLELPLMELAESPECPAKQSPVLASDVPESDARGVEAAVPDAIPAPISQRLWESISDLLLEALETPQSVEDLAARLDVVPAQVKQWIKRLEQENRIEKLKTKPVRFRKKPADWFS